MMFHSNKLRKLVGIFAASTLLAGCSGGVNESLPTPEKETAAAMQEAVMEYTVEPETFSLSVLRGDTAVPVSMPMDQRQVSQFQKTGDITSWIYPDDGISVSIEPEAGYLHVTLASQKEGDNQFLWPAVSGETYYIPFGEGKRIPADDAVWSEYLGGGTFTVLEQLSMPFWASAAGSHAVLYIMENPFRSDMVFRESGPIEFGISHQYPAIDPEKENSFRIYITENDPAAAAKIYRQYVKEQGKFVSLEQKAAQNPDIEKLYGAPFIY